MYALTIDSSSKRPGTPLPDRSKEHEFQTPLFEQFSKDPQARLAPHQFCAICKDIVAVIELVKDSHLQAYFLHHESYKQLEISAATGCHLCSLLLVSLDGCYNEEDFQRIQSNAETDDVQVKKEDGDGNEIEEDEDIDWVHNVRINNSWKADQLLAVRMTSEELVRLLRKPSSAPKTMKASEHGPQLLLRMFFPWTLDHDDRVKEYSGQAYPDDTDEDAKDHWKDARIGTLMLAVPRGNAGLRSVARRNITIEDFDEQWHEELLEPQTSIWSGSRATAKVASRWIQTCSTKHETCREAQKDIKTFPSRLLDLTNLENSEIRIVYTEDLAFRQDGSNLHYVTLSHRWGNSQILRLIHDNHEQFKQRIPVEDLPIVFQDAAQATRDIGFSFLWIDSLCILQDSDEDWSQESKIMGDIYRGGICNIAVVDAEDSSDGCFSLRNPLKDIPCRLPSNSNKDDLVASIPSDAIWVKDSMLSRRGWVFQERVLSPRTIYYSRKRVGWECRCGDATEQRASICDRSIDGIIFPLMKETLSYLEKPFDQPPDPSLTEPNSLSFYTAWTSILVTYTSCALTYGKDKLVAIHGIMQSVADRTNLHPVAGMWEEFLPIELLWHYHERRSHSYDRSPIQPIYRAPSWSWAAGDGEIWNWTAQNKQTEHYTASKFYLNITKVDVQGRENGEVSYAELHIQAPLVDMVQYGITDWKRDYLEEDNMNVTRYAVPILRSAWCNDENPSEEDTGENSDSEEESGEEKEEKADEEKYPNSGYDEHGLIVIESDQHHGYYVRVGYYNKRNGTIERTPIVENLDQDYEKQSIVMI